MHHTSHCPTCGYNLQASTADKCPECGQSTQITEAQWLKHAGWWSMRKHWWLLFIAPFIWTVTSATLLWLVVSNALRDRMIELNIPIAGLLSIAALVTSTIAAHKLARRTTKLPRIQNITLPCLALTLLLTLSLFATQVIIGVIFSFGACSAFQPFIK